MSRARKSRRQRIRNRALNHVHKKVYAVGGGRQHQDIGHDEAHQPPAIPGVGGRGGGVMLRYEKIERRGERSDPLEKSLQRDCYESPRKAAAPWQLVAVLLMKRWAERQYRGMRQNSRTLVSS